MSMEMEGRVGIDVETAELLTRKSDVTEREVEFRRKLGIVFGDQVLVALALDIAYGIIPGKEGLFWKIAEPVMEEYKDVVDLLNPSEIKIYADKKPDELTKAHLLLKVDDGPTPPKG